MLADIMRFVPWPGFGPFECYDADHTRRRRRDSSSSPGSTSTCSSRPATRPGHVTYSIPAEQALFSGDVLFQGSIGRTDLPGGDHATLMRSIATLLETLPGRDRVYPGHMGTTTLGRERATNPFLAELGVSRADPGAARHVRRAGRPGARARRARGPRAADPRARRLRADRDAGVRGDRAVRARRRRVDRHRAEGDVHVRRRRARVAHAAPEGTAPVCRAYLEHGMHKLPAAGEALVPVELLPPRAPAGRPLPPVLADRRRGDRLRRPRGRRRADPAARRAARGARRARPAAADRLASARRRPAPRYREELQAYLRAHADELSPTRSRAHRPQPAARVRRRPPRHAAGHGRRAAAARPARRRGRASTSQTVRGAARRRRRRLRGRPDARARPRLLHAHGLRVHLRRARRAVGRRRRRPLRRAGRAARRPADAGHRLGGRRRADAAGRAPRRRSRAAARPLRRLRRAGAARRPRSGSPPTRAAPGHAARLELAGRSLKGQLKQADRAGARYVAILGDEGTSLKDMETGEQQTVEPGTVMHHIAQAEL